MAYVLSLRPHSPLKRSFSDNPYLQSCSPLKDVTFGALRDISSRNPSACSLYALGSNDANEWLHGTENTPPPLTSHSLLDLLPEREGYEAQVRATDNVFRKRNYGFDQPPPPFPSIGDPSEPFSRRTEITNPVAEPPESDPGSPEPMVLDSNTDDDTEFFDLYDAIHIPHPEPRWSDRTGNEPRHEPDKASVGMSVDPQPFRRWMSTLRRRHIQRRKDPVPGIPASAVQFIETDAALLQPTVPTSQMVRRLSESMSSSMGCVTAAKSASITIASASIAPLSDTGALQGKIRLGNRSSHYSDARRSTESHRGALGPVIDESAWLRSVQRRKIVEELISSEESYIADLKVLINVRSVSLRPVLSQRRCIV